MELSLSDLKELVGTPTVGNVSVNGGGDGPWNMGDKVLIRTVTMTVTGRIVYIHPGELLLREASWIADTGRFTDALKSCTFAEVEPFPNDVVVGRGAIVDATWIDTLPGEQK